MSDGSLEFAAGSAWNLASADPGSRFAMLRFFERYATAYGLIEELEKSFEKEVPDARFSTRISAPVVGKTLTMWFCSVSGQLLAARHIDSGPSEP